MYPLNLLVCTVCVLSFHSSAASFYDNPEQDPLPSGPDAAEELHRKWDTDWGFSGLSTFAHLKHVRCLSERDVPFDIGLIGAPFDTAVTYRPGARFGPRAIRAASARQTPSFAFNHRRGLNPYLSSYTILDCGDIPVSPFDNALALRQMSEAFLELGSRTPALLQGNKPKPKLLTLGGDHSVALPALRALNKVHGGPVAVLHFDSHLDTWNPAKYTSSAWESAQSHFNHGSMFWIASNEGLILNGSSAHAGLRTRLTGNSWKDYDDDDRQGFLRISSDDIDDMGTKGIIDAIIERIGLETPTYLSIDIDVIDPGLCPGTGTPEPGGWTSRELIRIIRGLEDLNVVGADIVEVAPAYDGIGEQTALTAAQLGFEIMTNWVGRGLRRMESSTEANTEPKDEL
ncbi:MAG: hypothetical protein LQ345_001987 [Seirophora villosa]|nr:MAG: hypothetical protein LQ345_001987 [Seirophora villosa]